MREGMKERDPRLYAGDDAKRPVELVMKGEDMSTVRAGTYDSGVAAHLTCIGPMVRQCLWLTVGVEDGEGVGSYSSTTQCTITSKMSAQTRARGTQPGYV